MTDEELKSACQTVLKNNDRQTHTVPAEGFYPHQWLWDSCFIAIGQRHFDIQRAKQEILSLLKGQWSNGMLPNMVLTPSKIPSQASNFWRSKTSPYSPDNVETSGITQPPMLAEAIVRIGEKLSKNDRILWYRKTFPALLRYHEWLYNERDPHNEGLVLQIHPWETGLDNTPPWIYEISKYPMPLWLTAVKITRFDHIISLFRKDTFLSLPGERISTLNALSYYNIQRRLRRRRYNIDKILGQVGPIIEDVSYNSIFIRANTHLKNIAKILDKPLKQSLLDKIKQTENAIEGLWDEYSKQYYSRNFTTHKLIKIPTIGALLPLYSGAISKEKAKIIVDLINNTDQFAAHYPLPTVPLNSPWYDEHKYWQGPTWININWLIIDGLKRYGFDKEAEHIKNQSLKLVASSGSYEYFSAKNGSPAGAKNFSWTAALIIDLINQK